MKNEVLFLGTGTSQGVPIIGCDCPVCCSDNKKDNRLRASILIKINFFNILIDIGPDFRSQMLQANNSKVNSILITHKHRDHTAGLDDLRPIYYLNKKPIDIYGEDKVLESINNDFKYLFDGPDYPGKPKINLNTISNNSFFINDIKITPIRVMHHKLPIFGYRIGDLSYITDAKYISNSEKNKIKGSKVLIINSLQRESHISHYNLQESLELINEINPQTAYLTHISHNMGLHNDVQKELPANVFLAYDQLSIII
jgi:phosphoribosyl 1,2-cyclic phosphate phosphodiesterase